MSFQKMKFTWENYDNVKCWLLIFKRSKTFSKIENKLKWTFSKISENHPKFTYMTTAVKSFAKNIFLEKESVGNVLSEFSAKKS